MRLLGTCYEELGQDGTEWLKKACSEAPNTREPWVELAMIYYRRCMWRECYEACKSALKITDKAEVYTMDPSVWGSKPHDLLAISAHNLGLKEEAIEQGQIAVDLDPNDLRLTTNLEYYRK